jgi:transposase
MMHMDWVDALCKTFGVRTRVLHHQPPPGRPSKLSAEQQAQLPALLAKGPEAFGFRGRIWTTRRVAHLIQQECGVSYHPAHCSRLLRDLKQSQQKPTQKAMQRNEAAIQMWKEQRLTGQLRRVEQFVEQLLTRLMFFLGMGNNL